jgi:intracellular sulfur oxidation DsrE/DsrF family protein
MTRKVVSVVASAATLQGSGPALEANAYAMAQDVDLDLLLRGTAIEAALVEAGAADRDGAGPTPRGDLRCLLESGVGVFVDAADLRRQGIEPRELHPGVRVLDAGDVALVLGEAEAVLAW